MGRKRIVTRDAILDAAEEAIGNGRGHHLSLQLVAETANITKGSIAHNFKTKDELILAVFSREAVRFHREAAIAAEAENTEPKQPDRKMPERDAFGYKADNDPLDLARGWIAATRRENGAAISKAAGLIINMMESESRRQAIAASYGRVLDEIDIATPDGRAAFVAFMAVEGISLLRGFGILELSEDQWKNCLDIIREECLEKVVHDS
ncbi:TetR/AcrR family transcriptional regulator [Pseudochelatococcus contaminans]|uniref:AcrR family transcriptional regulator n=1 Tax=Pseudochelatococcus contaminans TaxID=1538103 RepID=A0A7W6EJ27_9HYPH|nr:TetR/AcrR family transcriptional regulator [Pseudochelatococcus contaminans]MBB3811372.1 AcrR family transcriptional regulator [Pseudochelatococcus contaminans]